MIVMLQDSWFSPPPSSHSRGLFSQRAARSFQPSCCSVRCIFRKYAVSECPESNAICKLPTPDGDMTVTGHCFWQHHGRDREQSVIVAVITSIFVLLYATSTDRPDACCKSTAATTVARMCLANDATRCSIVTTADLTHHQHKKPGNSKP